MESFFFLVLSILAVFCAWRALSAKRILTAALYLACVSAFVSAAIYLLRAPQVAVIELSVGAGLVTVLLVYALSVVGEDALDLTSIISKPMGFALALGVAILLGLLVVPNVRSQPLGQSPGLLTTLWEQRILDVWIQIALIFSGVMGILGLLSEAPGKYAGQ